MLNFLKKDNDNEAQIQETRAKLQIVFKALLPKLGLIWYGATTYQEATGLYIQDFKVDVYGKPFPIIGAAYFNVQTNTLWIRNIINKDTYAIRENKTQRLQRIAIGKTLLAVLKIEYGKKIKYKFDTGKNVHIFLGINLLK